jgi:hypothetical protein
MNEFKKDDKVYVKERHCTKWIAVHFSEYGNGIDCSQGVFVFNHGRTSFTAAAWDTLHFDECMPFESDIPIKDIIYLS